MKQVGLTVEDAVRLATERVLPAGYKPEDYLVVNGEMDFPKRIAIFIVQEAKHLLFLDKQVQGYDPPRHNFFFRRFRLGK